MDNTEKWLSYLGTLAWLKGELDVSSWDACLRAASLKVEENLVYQELAGRIQLAGDHPRNHKLKSQIHRAYVFVGEHPDTEHLVHLPRPPKPRYEPDKLAAVASKITEVVDDEYLRLRSKCTVYNRTPGGFLHKLFQPGEKVLVFTDYFSQGEELWTHPGPAGDLSNLDYLLENQTNVWFLCQPVDGEFHHNPRQITESRRSEESVTGWRYIVLESDKAPKDLWLKTLVRLPLPIASIVESGGDSIHALVRIDADSKADWDHAVREQLQPWLTVLGADPGAMTAVRLTRLANCMRGEKGKRQRLLYLDDAPDEVPISQIALRDPDTLRTAWEKSL